MAMFMTYTSKHYGDVMTNHQDCSGVEQPLTGDGLAYASQHSDAMQLRNTQVNVSRQLPTPCSFVVLHAPSGVGAPCEDSSLRSFSPL